MPQDANELSGLSSLTIDAITGITDIVESAHHTFASFPGIWASPKRPDQPTNKGVSRIAYRNIRTISQTVANSIDMPIKQLDPAFAKRSLSPGREAAIAILNGVLGDHLVKNSNPLAITMNFRRNGKVLDRQSLGEIIDQSNGKIAVMVHGSCMNDLQWTRNGHDHGSAVAQEFGYEPLYLHYNTGRHISENGRDLAQLLEELATQSSQPLDLIIIAHSMGGLVSRSTCHYGKISEHNWLDQLQKLFFLGTPHHGAHLEKAGNWVDTILDANPYSAPFSRLGKIRSSGVTDLRFGNVVDEDWKGRDRFKLSGDLRVAVPLPTNVQCYSIAATTGKNSSILTDSVIGDGLVSINSSMGRHKRAELSLAFPPENQWIGRGISHWGLLDHPEVYAKLKGWLES